MTTVTHSAVIATFIKLLGLNIDEQGLAILTEICSVDADNKWRHADYRQVPDERDGGRNILEARALYGLLLHGDRTTLWVSQNSRMAHDSFRRMARLVESVPDLRHGDAPKIRYSNGGQRIELANGHRLLVTSPLGARGISADALLIDGLLTTQSEYSVYPTLLASANPQRVQRAGVLRP